VTRVLALAGPAPSPGGVGLAEVVVPGVLVVAALEQLVHYHDVLEHFDLDVADDPAQRAWVHRLSPAALHRAALEAGGGA